MSDLDRIEKGERVVSLCPEDEGATGEVFDTDDNHVRVRWDDAGNPTWARRDAVRREVSRTGDEMVERDEAAGFVTILLRDAIVLAGDATTVAAFDDVAVRRHFLGEVAALTETAMLALPDGALDSWSHAALRDAIGVVHIEAAACRVIARHEDVRASWLKTLSDAVRD